MGRPSGSGGAIRPLVAERDGRDLEELWRAATDARRQAANLDSQPDPAGSVLDRRDAFGIGLIDDDMLVSAAVAMPAGGDDGRSRRTVPGLMHVTSVATTPARWAEGLGHRVVRAILSNGMSRGYARAQLWTQADNPVSRHLYESLGFVWSGRRKVDDFGEDIVHYVSDLTAELMPPRPAARMLCLDSRDRVLLLNWRDPFDGHELWEPPGGGIEAGETPLQAVRREWSEETGLALPRLVGEPVLVGRDLFWLGGRYVGDEHFFLGRLDEAGDPDVSKQTEMEKSSYLGHRWSPWRQLIDLGGTDEPDVLAVLDRLDPHGPWATPGTTTR